MATKADTYALTPQMLATVDALATGATITDAAIAVGVTRQTVSEWANQHPGFRAELNRRRHELWGESSDRLRLLLPEAIATLERALATGSVRAALGVVKLCGMEGTPRAIGLIDPELIAAQDRDRDTNNRLRWDV